MNFAVIVARPASRHVRSERWIMLRDISIAFFIAVDEICHLFSTKTQSAFRCSRDSGQHATRFTLLDELESF
jgi:hypothetical protein